MRRAYSLLVVAALSALPRVAAAQSTTELLRADWRFTREPVEIEAASAAGFDDSGWQQVRLPHDWAIAGPFDEAADGSQGKLPWQGEGWYRKTIDLEAADEGRRVYLDFDGVMAFPKVYVNGALAGEWDYGYTPFRVDATDHVRWGETNVIMVHVDTGRWGSRWYPGAGIYRKVTLTMAEPTHLAQWGVRVRTNGDEREGTPANTAFVETTFENHLPEVRFVMLETSLVAPDGSTLESLPRMVRVPARNRTTVEQVFRVDGPLLWDVEHPHQYTVRTVVSDSGRELDRAATRFGFRTFLFTADDGFHLNGRRVQMYGVNLHHDLGPLGGAFSAAAAERQLRIMKEMGVNALRTSHNPPAREVVELCDEMGILVWDEVFDKWDRTAGRPDLEPPLPGFGHRQIRNTVLRDRNSPSVVLWSIGNELGGSEDEDGIEPVRMAMMSGFVRAYDLTRPVTMAQHVPGLVDGHTFVSLDVNGWNYAHRYDRNREVLPVQPLIYSESASALSTRGYYEPELPMRATDYPSTHQVSSYDLSAASWSDIVDHEFRLMERDTFIAGEFVWTGFDYLGEPTPFTREARSSYFGIVDLCGFPKDRYFLYRSHWRPDQTTVHVLPHWNWPERVGQNVPVFVYTNGDAAELFLNGRSLGVRRKGEVPERSPDLAAGAARATASSGSDSALLAVDPDAETGWRAAPGDSSAWWQVDLGRTETIGFVMLELPRRENVYAYVLSASGDGERWTELVSKPTARFPMWGGPSRVYHEVATQARFLRVSITEAGERAPIGLDAFSVHREKVENDYYDVTYDYRLRWNEVAYEPGELRAVAFRGGEPIGEARVETVGEPVALRLEAERTDLRAGAEDLAFVTVTAVDVEGREHPLADDLVRFTVSGPGGIAGTCSGNPLSYEPFQADYRHLFYGRALLVVRPEEGRGGEIAIVAEAEGLEPARLTIRAR
jgi:beta-galactosidase